MGSRATYKRRRQRKALKAKLLARAQKLADPNYRRESLSMADLNRIAIQTFTPAVAEAFLAAPPLMSYLRKRG